VALLGRLRGSGEWFRWMVEQMSQRLSATSQDVLPGKRVRLVDASVVCELSLSTDLDGRSAVVDQVA
jgi:hypothetical protein